jgi:hypothetical protein
MQEGFVNLVFLKDRERYLKEAKSSTEQDYAIRSFRVLTKSGEIRWGRLFHPS